MVFNLPFEVEHVVPASQGGEDVEFNLALACRSCNLLESSRLRCIDPTSGEEVALFHPRRQRWHQHFEVDREAGTIVGTTPTGRATADCLSMNSASQVQARRQWVRLGLFP